LKINSRKFWRRGETNFLVLTLRCQDDEGVCSESSCAIPARCTWQSMNTSTKSGAINNRCCGYMRLVSAKTPRQPTDAIGRNASKPHDAIVGARASERHRVEILGSIRRRATTRSLSGTQSCPASKTNSQDADTPSRRTARRTDVNGSGCANTARLKQQIVLAAALKASEARL
jgi:hypothetical protein